MLVGLHRRDSGISLIRALAAARHSTKPPHSKRLPPV